MWGSTYFQCDFHKVPEITSSDPLPRCNAGLETCSGNPLKSLQKFTFTSSRSLGGYSRLSPKISVSKEQVNIGRKLLSGDGFHRCLGKDCLSLAWRR